MKYRLLLLLILPIFCQAQSPEIITYKTLDTLELKLEIIKPPGFDQKSSYPTIIFFFGGGWNSGTTTHFEQQAQYLVKRGMIAVLADYRVKSRHQTSPFESLMDAKTAIRYLRKNAAKLGIDPNRIVASGGSAGGHLAAATATIEAYNESNDDLSVSCIPNALVLFNPVIDNGPGGYGFERIGEDYLFFSPIHNIRKGVPPTIFFLGTNDDLIPVETGKYYKTVMEKVGSRCDLKIYEGGRHGFFNPRNPEFFKSTLNETDIFLQSLGYLK